MGKETDYLKPIFVDAEFFIDPCDGSDGLADAKDVFTHIDSEFEEYGVTATGIATGETRVEIYEMKRAIAFVSMLNSLKRSKEGLLFTPHQIKKFIVKYLKWLEKDNCDTFLFFEINEKIFGAQPSFRSRSFNETAEAKGIVDLYSHRLNEKPLWPHGFTPRLVVPWVE